MAFQLRKWYLDLVTADGRVFIGYQAQLRWLCLSLDYYGHIFFDSSIPVHTLNSFHRVPCPKVTSTSVSWEPAGIQGQWNRLQPQQDAQLLKTNRGKVDWHCLMPLADATLRSDQFGTLAGRGYVEYLEMSIAPWRLPISKLIWGRFHGQKHTLVWIRWVSDTQPITLLLHNSARTSNAVIEDKYIRYDQCQLRLDNPVSLRSGSLNETVLVTSGWTKLLFPRSALSIKETKYRSHGVLTSGNAIIDEGWAIHETVEWP